MPLHRPHPLPLALRRLTLATLTLLAPAAWASGHLPPLPVPEEHYASFDACVIQLQGLEKSNAARADAQPVAQGNGSTRQTLVRSEGVVRVNDSTARYAVHIGYQTSTPDLKFNILRSNYSYEEYKLACNGGTLSGTREQGYYLEGQTPLPAPTQAAPGR